MSTITLANGKHFSCPKDSNILDAALAQSVVLEHSCRTGRCGACKTKVIEGETQIVKSEESLSAEEIKAGYILTCARTAISDMTLDIEDLGRLGALKIQTLPCRIDSLHYLSDDVIQVFLRLPPKNTFQYVSGQYIDIIVSSGARRSYSIANGHLSANKLELHIRKVPGGELSQYWFNDAKANDLLRFEGPRGTFCYRDKPNQNIIFLATGTGIAPIKSILEEMEASPLMALDKKLYVYWGGRTPEDLYWQPKFSNIRLAFKPVLSRPPQTWQGYSGYVQNAVLADKHDLTNSVVYACGSDQMIHSAQQLLTQHNLNPKNFYSDAFVSSK